MKDTFRKANCLTLGVFLKIIAGSFFCLAIVSATVIGCGWPGTTSHSVRFNDYQTEREMGRLPPLPTLANGTNEIRTHWELEDPAGTPETAYTLGEKRTEEVRSLWERADAAEGDGNLPLDRLALQKYLELTGGPRDIWFTPSGDRNSAIDRLDALSALDRGGNAAKVKAYLDARRAYDSGRPIAAESQALEIAKSEANLKDNVAYLTAAELHRQKNFGEAAKAFGDLARQYPRSEKHDAALFMAAVSTMKTSALYIPASGNSDYTDRTPADSATDQSWHDAFAAFQKVISEYPRGRYFNEARGWLAYLWLRRHDRAEALAQYYRLLADRDENARVEAAFSLTLVRSSATEDEMARVEKQLANEPEAALAYAYHNIYNYSIDPGDAFPPYDEEQIKNSRGEVDYEAQQRRYQEREKEWSQARAATTRRELMRTLNFSKLLMTRYPKLAIGGAFALRAAQASEELDDNEAAVSFARRALQSRLSSEERAQAFWTLGIGEHRLRRFDDAHKSLTTLLREYPTSQLTEGARRTLAMITEDAGDIDGALEQYIALGYDLDVGYFVDRLMTPEQLAAFIQRHPDSPKRNEFTYALGVRYLRANRWNDARKTLAQVRSTRVPDNRRSYYYSGNCESDYTINCSDPKNGDFDEHDNPIITARLVMCDIQTANDLEALQQRASEAEGDEAKAETLYQFASYQYEASSLLFYNPLASPGYWNLSQLAAEGRYRVANESQLLFNSTQEHERLARALKIYLDVVNRFPKTRAARDSLYTAAVCHDRLSNYNPYWREIYQNGLHAGERMVTYQDVKATYPNYQLPRGTFGWQPSTRTVNGGPGWHAPPQRPKPKPRLTKSARLKIFGNSLVASLTSFWNEKGRRWLTECVIVLGLWFTLRVAARNRKRLRARVARQRIAQSRQAVSYPWLELFWIDHVEPSRREQIKKFLGEKRQEFLELAKDRRSQPVLLRSLVSHSLLSGLVLALIWTVW
jgi:TolA-binding protein